MQMEPPTWDQAKVVRAILIVVLVLVLVGIAMSVVITLALNAP